MFWLLLIKNILRRKIEKLKGNNKIVEKYLYKYCLNKEQNIDKIGEV